MKGSEMDLLKRYLNGVRFWLPAAQQDDIIAELSEDLRSQAEDRESAKGRELTGAEWEAFLKERGHPLVVASGYLPQRYLIGPVLFPVYWFVLKIVMLCVLIPSVTTWIAMVILTPAGSPLHRSLWSAFWPALITTIPVTLGFAVLERYQAQWLTRWSPSSLPTVRTTLRISRGTSLFELIVNVMFAGWGVRVLLAPALLDFPGMRVALTGSGRLLLLGTILLALAIAVLAGVNLFRPHWTRTRRTVKASIHGAAAIFYGVSLAARPLLWLAGSGVPAEANGTVDLIVSSTVLGAIAVSAIYVIVGMRQALKGEGLHNLGLEAFTLVS